MPDKSSRLHDFLCAKDRACERSLTPEYKGCAVHLNVILGKIDGIPCVVDYALSDWYGPETVATFVNGRETS